MPAHAVSINSVRISRTPRRGRRAIVTRPTADILLASLLDTTTLDYASTVARARFVYRGTCRDTMAPRVTPVLVLSFSRLVSRSLCRIGIVINRHGLSPLTGARPPLCEIPKANKRSNAKKHLFPILYLTQLVSPYPALSLARCGRFSQRGTRVSWACLSHARTLSRGPALPLLLPPEINEIARRYDRYGRANGPTNSASSAYVGSRHARFHRARYPPGRRSRSPRVYVTTD